MPGYLQPYGMFPICCGSSGTSGGSSGGSTTPTGPAGGSLSGTYPNPLLANTGVTAGTYGSSSQVPVFIVNSSGQITSVTNTPLSITSSQISDLSETVQDIVGTAFIDSANIDFTYNDPGNTITADLTNTAVSPGTYGSNVLIPIITVDTKGRVTSLTTIPASGSTGVTPPGGANTQVQFNNGGVFGGSPTFVFDPTTNRLGLGTGSPTAKQDIVGQIDEVQLKVKGNATQTNDIVQIQNSAGQNQLTVANNGAIELGTGAVATELGQLVHANGNFSTPGDAQTSEYPLRVATSTGTQTPLSIDGITEQITIPVNKTIIFSGVVGARSSIGDSAYWEIRGVIKNDSGTTSLVGTPLVSYIASDLGALTWNSGNIYSAIAINADNATDSLAILVTGESGVTIRWNSFIKTVEIGF